MTADVLVVGGTGVDHTVHVPALPLPPRGTLLVPPIHSGIGHTGTGVALGCRRLGLRTVVADVVGDDAEGRLVAEHLARAGVAFHPALSATGTRRSVNLMTPDGGRMSLYDSREPLDHAPDPALWRARLPDVRHVHVSIMDWARAALPDATAAGLSTSTDLHDWDGRSDHHRDFAHGADLVFVSAVALGDDEPGVVRGILANGRAQAVVVMDGAAGSRLTVRGHPARAVPAARLDGPLVDTNGAGDAYVAAFLFTLLSGAGYRSAAVAGSVAGAFACGRAGTHTRLIDADDLAREVARQGPPA